MKLFLALETCLEAGSLGVFKIQKDNVKSLLQKNWSAQSEQENNKNRHSHKLPLEIQKTLNELNLTWEDLDFLAVDIGPGRFTGVRLALSVVQTLSFGLSKPIYPVHSLRVTAEPFLSQKKQVSVAFNAFKNQIYFMEFENKKQTLPPQAVSLDWWIDYMSQKTQGFCVGDIEKHYALPSDLKKKCQFECSYPTAQNLAQVVFQEFQESQLKSWTQIKPFYLRSVDK